MRILQRQLSLIDHAPISTLHAFCAKDHPAEFSSAGDRSGFSRVDGDEAGLLRLEVARDLFMERYDRADGEQLRQFVDDFGEGKDEWLIQTMVRTYELLRSLLEPQEWLKKAVQRIDEAIAKPLERVGIGAGVSGRC
jgi:ATP-dependent helicase/nuclease subunit A